MQQHGPWTLHTTREVAANSWFTVHHDEVTDPAGRRGRYEWVGTRDQVRVAAVDGHGLIYLIEQCQYLARRSFLQAPGGTVDDGEGPQAAAARELAEETGLVAARWTPYPPVWPMPGISPARVHLYAAEGLEAGPPRPEGSEADLSVRVMPLQAAVTAALDGRIGCAASAFLILAVAHKH